MKNGVSAYDKQLGYVPAIPEPFWVWRLFRGWCLKKTNPFLKTGKNGIIITSWFIQKRRNVVSNSDMAFVLREHGQEVWKVLINDQVLPTTWNSKGAAEAGLVVEKRRIAIRLNKQIG